MPNRIIKESICTSDSIESLTDFQEAFFYRLIVNCDDYGRMDARPAILKARLYPLREKISFKDIQRALEALEIVGCIMLYEVSGKPYLLLPSWENHQQIRAKRSKYPEPDSIGNQLKSYDCKCPRNPIQSESESESESESNPPYIPHEGDGAKKKKPPVQIPEQSETGFSDRMQEAFEDWLIYKKERREQYKDTGLKTLVKKLKSSVEQYGEEPVIDMLTRTIAAGYQGPVWDWLNKAKQEPKEKPKKDYGWDGFYHEGMFDDPR